MDKITLLDGASGTLLWNMAEAEGTPKIPVWRYNTVAPHLVKRLAEMYLSAGSEIIYTNTFCANPPAVKQEGCSLQEILETGTGIAREAASGYGARTALDFGPLMNALEPFGTTSEDECRAYYREMCRTGAACGADLIVLETFMDAKMLEIAASEAAETGLPLFCTMSFSAGSRTFFGSSIDEMLEALKPFSPAAVGLNCSFGPVQAVPVMQEFAQKTDLPLILKPNTADLPAEEFAKAMEPALNVVSYAGACCGSDPSYISKIKELAERR
ncbi:MAG: homocysteine S-methyltransferase family protein [Clostridia bacterium]|nr:homocysteine S-methyltransferase family protein [Clostridia bacterium]